MCYYKETFNYSIDSQMKIFWTNSFGQIIKVIFNGLAEQIFI